MTFSWTPTTESSQIVRTPTASRTGEPLRTSGLREANALFAEIDTFGSTATRGKRTRWIFSGSITARLILGNVQAVITPGPRIQDVVFSSISTFPTENNPADELRALTGLTVDRLLQLLDVTRPTYYSWSKGGPIATDREHRLLRILAVVRRAFAARQSAEAVRRWLEEPVEGANASPFEVLRSGDYTTASGLALVPTTPSGQRLLVSSTEGAVRSSGYQKRREVLRRRGNVQ